MTKQMYPKYPVIDFHQFGGVDSSDRLLLFAAKAKDLAAWAGIPRKGWRIRMLFQRWITPGRQKELRDFWERASTPDDTGQFTLGPTSIVIAMRGEPVVEDGKISLEYLSPVGPDLTPVRALQVLATLVVDVVAPRLDGEGRGVFERFKDDPLQDLPSTEHNYVLEFALQLLQMARDPEWFVQANGLDEDEIAELVVSMEALVRPAVVVDGQHRLWGAQAVDRDVWLPVVAITDVDWPQQIYQFVVINEKAQKVDSELLNDIFASSLTPEEQESVRSQFERVKVDIEQRIAGVLAGRDPESPFFQMITLNLPNPPESEANAYISQAIIQCLIEGGRGSRGWRSDDDFYRHYVSPTFSERLDWEDWRTGAWRRYWFAFWEEVRDYYRPRARKVRGGGFDVWSPLLQSNLTKGVGLKLFQRFFIEKAIEAVRSTTEGKMFDALVRRLGEEEARKAIEEELMENAIPADLDLFRQRVRDDFLKQVPVRFFTGNWEKSLDDSSGHDKILFQLREAYSRDNWRASGGGVFIAE